MHTHLAPFRLICFLVFLPVLAAPIVCSAADGDGGAVAQHWAYQPIADPAVPQVRDTSWVRNGIDQFILRRLEQENVYPSQQAPRHTLIRRAHLDLIGLPPSPQEVRRWMTHPGSDWYMAMVDQLLMSPHYGERWARLWLDQARYADTDGYEKDSPRPHAYQWRDWVIDAMNRDLAFDQFTEQQIAGDLLPGASEQTQTATGFHRNTLTNREGGIDKEEDRVKQTVDRVNTTTTVWLGLTVKCAQCHDHKYDPISHDEYYQLYAFFNNSDEKNYPLSPTYQQQRAYDKAQTEHQQKLHELTANLAKHREAVVNELGDLEAALLKQYRNIGTTPATNGLIAHFELESKDASLGLNKVTRNEAAVFSGSGQPETVEGVVGQALKLNGKDQRLELKSEVPFKPNAPFTFAVWVFYEGGVGSVITKLDESTNFHGIDFTINGGSLEVHLVETWPDNAIKVSTEEKLQANAWHHLLANYDGSKKAAGVAIYVDGKSQRLKVETDQLEGSFETDQPIRLGSRRESSYLKGRIDEARIYDRALNEDEIATLGMGTQLTNALKIAAIPVGDRTEPQTDSLIDYFLMQREEPQKISQQLSDLSKKPPRLSHGQSMGLVERETPRRTFTHLRGDFLQKGDEVQPGTPRFLPPLSGRDGETDRLDLARWILDPANPLTPRVTVNRIWQQYFGRGIVPTGEDFGSEGEPPSHPQLLDWLATRFVDSGWSMKYLHRIIVGSATYRQSAAARPELATRDPYNTWLARQNRLRVDAETVRDLALASSGLLDDRLKGPSVFPPLPEGIIELAFVDVINRNPWKMSPGGNRYRRGLYTFFQRTSPYPMLALFDAPDSNTACTRRDNSNTPLQALTLWNDPVFMECAKAMAVRIVRDVPGGADAAEQRIAYAVGLALNRSPDAVEVNEIRQLYDRGLRQYEADPALAAELLKGTAVPASLSPSKMAAWTTVARTLINLDEFITRE